MEVSTTTLIIFGFLVIDKLVTMTKPTFKIGKWEVGKYDDIIWTAIKGAAFKAFKKKD